MPRTDAAILVLDVETTGTDAKRDQIIELSIQEGLSDSSATRAWRIKPTVPIHPEACAVHGIGMEDLVNCGTFAVHANEIRHVLERAEMLVGYNVGFDLGMLQAEFRRLGQAPIDLSRKILVDPYRLWRQCEPRTLQDAHRRFVGGAFDDAHSAAADTAATARVLLAMLDPFGLRGKNWQEIAAICEPDRHRWIGPSHHIQWHGGVATVMFGKHKRTPLDQLATEDDGDYLKWMRAQDFPPHVREICTRALQLDRDALRAWIEQGFGSAPETDDPPSTTAAPSPARPPRPSRQAPGRSVPAPNTMTRQTIREIYAQIRQ